MNNVRIAFKILNGEESAPQPTKRSVVILYLMSRWKISAARQDLLQVGIQLTPHIQ
jgi:hypothetical protein